MAIGSKRAVAPIFEKNATVPENGSFFNRVVSFQYYGLLCSVSDETKTKGNKLL
jgi:hypothetical protein